MEMATDDASTLLHVMALSNNTQAIVTLSGTYVEQAINALSPERPGGRGQFAQLKLVRSTQFVVDGDIATDYSKPCQAWRCSLLTSNRFAKLQ